VAQAEGIVRNLWFSFLFWVQNFLHREKEQNCSACEQLRLDLSYERAEKEKWQNLYLEASKKTPVQPRKEYPWQEVSRGRATMSQLKTRALRKIEELSREDKPGQDS
jgi:hypothetical protein